MRQRCHRIGLRLLALALPLFLVGAARSAPETEPTDTAGPAAPAAPDPTGKVLILPFVPINGAEGDSWIGKSIQQSVLTDVLTGTSHQASAGDAGVSDAGPAVDAARKAGARYVVFGSIHVSGDDVRLTGTVTDADGGQVLGALKVTGSLHDLFAMEDALGAQVKRVLYRAEARAMSRDAAGTGDPADAPAIQATGAIRLGDRGSTDGGSDAARSAYNRSAYGDSGYNNYGAYPAYPVYASPSYGGGYSSVGIGGYGGYGGYYGYPWWDYGFGGSQVFIFNNGQTTTATPGPPHPIVAHGPVLPGRRGGGAGGTVVHGTVRGFHGTVAGRR